MSSYSTTISGWPSEDRPREKLLYKGEDFLTNSELVAILLRTGTRGESAIDLARRILTVFPSFRAMVQAELSEWYAIKGLGPSKVSQIKASLEIGKRFREEMVTEKRVSISSSLDIVKMVMPRMRDLKKETVRIVFLDSRNRIQTSEDIEQGSVNQAYPVIREIFQEAISKLSSYIICVHNHPSGEVHPSRQDILFTQKLCLAGNILQIYLLDHIIIGNNCYYSFEDEGDLERIRSTLEEDQSRK